MDIVFIWVVLSIIYSYKKERDKQKYVKEHTVIIREKKWLNV